MSTTTIIRVPPPPPIHRKNGGNRKYHTLHYDRHIFTIQKNGTSVVSFRNKNDAIHFGKMLESHFDMTHMWPMIDFEHSVLYKNSKSSRLKYIDLVEWNEENLRNFCIRNVFNMLDIHRFEDDKRLVGNSVLWEAPMDFYVNILNEKINE